MDDPGLGSVVCRLQLRDVDDASTHAGCSNEAPTPESRDQFLTMTICPFLLLPSPMQAGRMCAVVDAIHIGSHDITVMLHSAIEKITLGPGNPSIGNEDVEAAIELVDDFIDFCFDVEFGAYIDLICFTYGENE